jgi:uncharacterized repeat protein (TIGR02543 family)
VNDGEAIGALPVPTRAGCGFDGWFTGEGTQYSDTSTVTAAITLYARWIINPYTVTFDVNEGDSLGAGQDTRIVNGGTAIGALPVPTRAGYGFDGWFTGEGAQYSDTSTITEAITLYAHWDSTATDLWDGTIAGGFAGGGGTVTDPYIISRAAQLAYLARRVNFYGETYTGKYFILTRDLDLEGHEWTAIGTSVYSLNVRFMGIFDGDSHVIYRPEINKSSVFQGLFGYLDGATISNLGLEEVAITGGNDVGGIAGWVHSGSIENCYSTGEVSGTDYVGGIAGTVSGGSVENCYSTGTVSGRRNAGGIAGIVSGGSIDTCYSTGTVSGSEGVGGIAGLVDHNGSISGSYSTGEISGTGNFVGAIA